MSTTTDNRYTALQVAFDNFTSDSDGLTAREAMALPRAEFENRVTVWQPFENWETDDLKDAIEALAGSIVEAFA